MKDVALTDQANEDRGHSGFALGTLVLLTLHSPREKFFGSLWALTPAGITLKGMNLNSLDDFAAQLKAGEKVIPGTIFFPMHRVEKMEVDQGSGEVPAIRETLTAKTGRPAEDFWGIPD